MRRGTKGFASKQKWSESVGEKEQRRKENRGGGKPGGGGRGSQIYKTKVMIKGTQSGQMTDDRRPDRENIVKEEDEWGMEKSVPSQESTMKKKLEKLRFFLTFKR